MSCRSRTTEANVDEHWGIHYYHEHPFQFTREEQYLGLRDTDNCSTSSVQTHFVSLHTHPRRHTTFCSRTDTHLHPLYRHLSHNPCDRENQSRLLQDSRRRFSIQPPISDTKETARSIFNLDCSSVVRFS